MVRTAGRPGWIAWLALITAVTASADEPVSFKRDVVPILNRDCVMCHMEGTELGGLSLYPDPRGNLIDMRSRQCPLSLVDPGKPESSYLLFKMLGTQESVNGKGRRMPWDYSLPAADIDLMRRWILEGAPDN